MVSSFCSEAPSSVIYGQYGENIVSKHEYSTLASQREISESVINWRLCDLSQEYPFNSSSVLVLNSDFYQSFECLWRTGVTVKPPVRSVIEWFNFSLNSAQIVILPLCWRGHLYLLVAILNPIKPSIQVLESLAGSSLSSNLYQTFLSKF